MILSLAAPQFANAPIAAAVDSAPQPPASSSHVPELPIAKPGSLEAGDDSSQTTALDARQLPADLASSQEIIDQRTANSATFRNPDGSFTSIIDASSMHYRDAQGNWQVIDPTFEAVNDSYVVERNSIRTRAGKQAAWLSAGTDSAAINWQAQSLGLVSADGQLKQLTEVASNAQPTIELRDEDRRLRYTSGWTSPFVAEEIASRPDSIEHLTLLLQRPELPASVTAPQYLELRATLKLNKGSTLWADGKQQTSAFTTPGALEIHDATGRAAIALKPVRAHEGADDAVAIGGEYAVELGKAPGEWIVGVRTPWAWWADRARQYPAVIDPEMIVLQSTGFGTGMAWVANGAPNVLAPEAQSQNMQFGELMLGSFYTTTAYRGYVQFNSVPYLLTNAPISVSAAYLDVTPDWRDRPGYDDSPTDWKKQNMQWPAKLYALGQCPGQCNGFSLAGGQPAHTWSNSPSTSNSVMTEVEPGTSHVLAVKGPDVKGGTYSGGTGQTTTWNVTGAISTWNLQKPRPADGPMFMLQMSSNCTINAGYPDNNRMNFRPAGAYKTGSVSLLNPAYIVNFPSGGKYVALYAGVGQCTRVHIPPNGARLRIQYTVPTLPLNANLLNTPGIPSYDAAFDSTTTYHEYSLGTGIYQRWRGVAIRSNHSITPALPARLSMELYGPGDKLLTADGGTDKDQTLFALIDENNGAAFNADFRLRVQPSAENNYADDGNRNYRMDYLEANLIAAPYGQRISTTLYMPSTDLLALKQLSLVGGDNVQVTVTVQAPYTQAVSFAVARPTSGGLDQVVRSPENNKDGLLPPTTEANIGSTKLSALTFSASVGGNWALAFINQGRPVGPLDRGVVGQPMTITYSILRCPEGAIPTAKWGCQPVILPRLSVTSPYTTPTPVQTAVSLTIYSEGGFAVNDASHWCTTNEGQGTPIIGPSVGGRWVAIGQGSVCLNGSTVTTTADSGVFLTIQTGVPITNVKGQFMPGFIYGDTALSPLLPGVPTGVVTQSMFFSDVTLAPGANTQRTLKPFAQWKGSSTTLIDLIDMNLVEALGFNSVQVPVVADTTAQPVTTTWAVIWELYPSPTSPPDLPYVFNPVASQSPTFTLPITISTAQVRILGAKPGAAETVDFWKKEVGPDVEYFQADSAKLTLDDSLGGATKNVKVVVLVPGKTRKLDKSYASCGPENSCIDLRRDDFKWLGGQGENNLQMWELPDIHITGQAGSVMFSRAGQLNVFSTDQPNEPSDVSVPFSFDTWDAVVSVRQGICDGQPATIIEGTGKIALPMLGNDGGSGDKPIEVAFTLCKTALRAASFSFDVTKTNLPPIPVGSTGLGINLLSGGVDVIDQGDTEITLQVGFQSLSKYPINQGNGTITINTGGFFQIDGHATVVSYFDADFKVAVAWSPLDVLIAGDMGCCDDLISGGLYMHTWVGQGWQHKYSWLKNNNDQHFTGSINATLRIPSGYVVDDWPFVLPPFQISLSNELAFGEFCTNSNCSGDPKWGMSATIEVLGYDVGVYVDSGGPDLILGSNDHELIDQFGGSSKQLSTPASSLDRPAIAADVQPQSPQSVFNIIQLMLKKKWKSAATGWSQLSPASAGCQINGFTHTCPFTMTVGTGRAMFVTTWQNGPLDVALIKPDSTVITPSNAAANGISVTQVFTPGLSQVAYVVNAPAGSTLPAGTWKLKLAGVDNFPAWSNVHTNYGLMFATDLAAPTINWLSPTTDVTPNGSGIVNLQWQAIRPGKPLTDGAKIELFYVPYADKPITPTAFAGNMLTDRYTATLGSYAWDARGLASGAYAVGARLDDHFNGNGHIVAWAPGRVIISDTTPPPVPTIVFTSFLTLKDALIIGWEADLTTPDLAGYIISYTIPSWDLAAPPLTRIRRIVPSPESNLTKVPFMPLLEKARLGGLLGGTSTTACVRAYDASGNVSDCNPFYQRIAPVSSDPRLGPVEGLVAQPVSARAGAGIALDWRPPLQGTPAGYLVDWQPTACKLPNATTIADQGTPPLYIGNSTAYMLTGLTPAQMYRFEVSAVSPEGYVGPITGTQAMFFSQLGDADHDGIPDQWASVFGLTGADALATADPDHDTVLNLREYALGSFPNQFDSNGDGYSDGEAVDAGLDPCGLQSPPYHQRPKPTLASTNIFKFATSINGPKLDPQVLTILNLGNGSFDWTADKSASWITLGASRGTAPSNLLIGADLTGLSVGSYTGLVTVTTTSAALVASASAEPTATTDEAVIEVTLDVLPTQLLNVYLPIVLR